MNLRTITFWLVYNSNTKKVIGTAKTKKALLKRWGDLRDTPWCAVVKMKGHYVRRSESRNKHG